MIGSSITKAYQSAYCHDCEANQWIVKGHGKALAHYGLSEPYPQVLEVELECGHNAKIITSLRNVLENLHRVSL